VLFFVASVLQQLELPSEWFYVRIIMQFTEKSSIHQPDTKFQFLGLHYIVHMNKYQQGAINNFK